ncbi:ThuA domain-containing protein [Novosphingobium sp. BL-52-GroH]|uniref:ThuA domain-containing protein n=1 Tax=Novosphingobium sp. BL-52-GroH TaxID=3349877 RepID=UPI0038509686
MPLFAMSPAAASARPFAAPALDCAMAKVPFSTHLPLSDLLASPAARAVLDQEAPNLISDVTRNFGGGDFPPGFGNILDVGWLLRGNPDEAAITKRLNRRLAVLPVTRAVSLARCARYDVTPANLPAKIDQPAILVFEKVNGFLDRPSFDAAHTALTEIAKSHGWTLVFSDKPAVFNPRDLKRFRAVVWNNISGDALTLTQRAAFRRWIEQGGGYVGIHGAGGDPVWFWDWYADTLVGARFAGHPNTPHYQNATVRVEPGNHPAVRGLPSNWQMSEEWYSFERSPRAGGARVLATLDESTYQPIGMNGASIAMGDHPISWTRCIANGRSFYTAIGHMPEAYSEPNSRKLLDQGIAWAAGLTSHTCRNGGELIKD